MQKELNMWKEENEQHVKALKAEQRFLSLFPFSLSRKCFYSF